MPRDELRQPLRKRSLSERLWAKRPGALADCIRRACRHLCWRCRLAVAYSPSLRRRTRCDRGHPAGRGTEDHRSTTPDAAAEDTAAADEAAETVLEAEEAPPKDYSQEASIIMAPHRPLKAAPIADVIEQSPDGPLPRISKQGRKPSDVYAQVTPTAVITSDRPKIAILLGGMGLNQRLTQKAIKELPGRHQLRLRALWREPAGAGQQGARRGSRGHAAAADGADRLSGQQSRSEDPAGRCAEEENLKSLRWHAEPLCRLSPASPTTWAAASWPYPTALAAGAERN